MGLPGPGNHPGKPKPVSWTIKKTGATSDVAPAEETALDSVRRQTTRVAIASGRRDNKLTSTKLTSPTAKL